MQKKERFNERPLFVCLVELDNVKYSPVSVIDICSRTNTVLEKKKIKISLTKHTYTFFLNLCSH